MHGAAIAFTKVELFGERCEEILKEVLMKKEIDKTMSAIVLIALAVVWLIYFLVTQFSPELSFGIAIAKNVLLCLTYLVLLYNAWGWSENIIIRIVFLAITAFLIFCVIAQYIPAINMGSIPSIGLNVRALARC